MQGWQDDPVADGTADDDLHLALEVAVAASRLALTYFERALETSVKDDGTIVTEADHAVESLLRERLATHRPGDAILGEEGGSTGSGTRRWILDPIDGTRHFVAGRSDWGVHVALEADGELVLGIVTRPTQSTIWWARRTAGAYRAALADPFDVDRLEVSSTDVLDGCRLTSWLDGDSGPYERLEALPGWRPPMDLNAGLAVVEGTLDVLVECSPARIWDRAPYIVLVEEAGGQFHDLDGGRDPDASGCMLTNGRLDGQIGLLLGR